MLGNFRSQNAVAPLIERLHSDKVAGVRGAAAVALGMIGDETAVLPLAQVFSTGKKKKSENVFVVRAAAHSLGQIRSRSAVPPLIAALANDSSSKDVRREAAQSLGLIGDPSAIPALQAATADNDPHLSRIALEALRRIETRKLT